MAVYVIAGLTKTDEAGYAEYVRAAGINLKKYPGYRLAADGAARAIERDLPAERLVLPKFDGEATFDNWYSLEDYQAALQNRPPASDMQFKAVIKERDR